MNNTHPFPYEVTTEPNQTGRAEPYLSEMEEIYYHIGERNKPNLKKVERFFLRWQRYPEAWNYYYMALIKNNRNVEADKLLKKNLEVFPDYLFSRCNEAAELIRGGNLEEAMNWLGETPDLQRLYPNRTSFIEAEVINYYKIYVYWEIEKGNIDQAEKYLEMIQDFESAEGQIDALRYKIMAHKLEKSTEWFRNRNDVQPEYIKPEAPKGYTRKPFFHKEIETMLDDAQLAGKEQIDAILSLPRETAIADLEQLVYRALFEYNDEDYDRNNYQLLPHALWFLYEFRAVESTPIINCLLEMDSEAREFWYGDFYTEYAWFIFFKLLENNPAPTLETLRKPNLYNYSKSIVLDAIEQLALHHPEKSDNYIVWLDNLLQFHIDNIENENIYDTEFVGFIEYTALKLKADSLLPKLKILHDRLAIDESICGSYEDVETEMKSMFAKPISRKHKDLPTIYDLVDEENKFLKEYEEREKEAAEKKNRTLPKELEDKSFPKTGRNDPCPCGSGKKYKKCCGK